MSDYMKNQGLVDGITGCRNRQRNLEAEIEQLWVVVHEAEKLFVRGLHHTADLDDLQTALAKLGE